MGTPRVNLSYTIDRLQFFDNGTLTQKRHKVVGKSVTYVAPQKL